VIDDDAFIRFRDGGIQTLDFRSLELVIGVTRNAPNKISQDIIIFDVG